MFIVKTNNLVTTVAIDKCHFQELKTIAFYFNIDVNYFIH